MATGSEAASANRPRAVRLRIPEAVKAFELQAFRRHPLVLAEMHRTSRWRSRATLACVAVPVLAFFVALILLTFSAMGGVFAGLFAAAWPAVMLAGAALRAAGAVVAERTEDTAMQLVLTPLPKRAIAAARILPGLPPFLWGIVAALPVYILTGALSAPQLAVSWIPAGPVAWPLRIIFAAATSSRPPWPMGGLAGPVMAATDLGLVWIGAHMGAALAVRHGNLPMAALHFFGRTLLAALLPVFGFLFVGTLTAVIIGVITGIPDIDEHYKMALGVVLAIASFLATLFFLWQELLRDASRQAVEEFGLFDRLAMDAEDPPQGMPDTRWLDRLPQWARGSFPMPPGAGRNWLDDIDRP